MKIKRILLICFILLSIILSSCVTQRKCLEKFPPKETRDSVYIEKVTIKPIYLPGDTLTLDVPIDCPDQAIDVENGRLRQQLIILNRRLMSKVTVKPDTIRVPVVETKTVVKEVKVPEPVKFVPKFYRYTLWISIAFALFLAYKIKKIVF